MSELRNFFLDKGNSRPQQEVTVELGGECQQVIVQALSQRDFEQLQAAAETDSELYARLIMEMVLDPETGDKVFEKADLEQIEEAPFHSGSWFRQLTQAIDYVSGLSGVRPDNANSPAYEAITEYAMAMAQDIRDSETIEGDEAQQLLEMCHHIMDEADNVGTQKEGEGKE